VSAEHLYIHVPFCPKLCPYCNFYKRTGGADLRDAYVEALLSEIIALAPRVSPRTIFFGGGTPTMLTLVQLEKIVSAIHDAWDLTLLEEWTFEMNPATVNDSKAKLLLQGGVNRFSMGVQAWQPELLKTLGRIHSVEQVIRSVHTLRRHGAVNLNLDLIFGVPGQTWDHWEDSLLRTVEMDPDHISAYCLTYEEDTEFFRRWQRGELISNDEQDAVYFSQTPRYLEKSGYHQYEISNFAKAGFECRHNIAYWEGRDYLGLGPGAWSTLAGRRWRNAPDLHRYIEFWREGRGEVGSDFEDLSPEVRHSERVAFGLRMNRGLPSEWIREHVATPTLLKAGYLEPFGNRLRLTGSGRLVADSVAAALID
jgi:oxygen-independent coproporphyrinogen-3 oxidase